MFGMEQTNVQSILSSDKWSQLKTVGAQKLNRGLGTSIALTIRSVNPTENGGRCPPYKTKCVSSISVEKLSRI